MSYSAEKEYNNRSSFQLFQIHLDGNRDW